MAGYERRIDRARRDTDRALVHIGRDIRQARLEHDLSQASASRAAGLSASTWSRLERGVASNVPVVDLACSAAAVGLVLSVRAHPGGVPVRDHAHLELLGRLRRRLGPRTQWQTEVPLPNPGDLRAWDALIRVARVRVGVEAETRGRDSQALQRRLALKRRDGAVDHVILLLADTRHNRGFLRLMDDSFRDAFPVPGPVALEHLAAGRDPGGSSIVLL